MKALPLIEWTRPKHGAAAEALSVEATALSVDEGKAEAAALSIDWEKVVAVSQKFLPILIQIALKLRG